MKTNRRAPSKIFICFSPLNEKMLQDFAIFIARPRTFIAGTLVIHHFQVSNFSNRASGDFRLSRFSVSFHYRIDKLYRGFPGERFGLEFHTLSGGDNFVIKQHQLKRL